MRLSHFRGSKPFPLRRAILAANIGKNWPDLPVPIGTFARHSTRLATASWFLFRRRCLVARYPPLATSSPDFLQGTSEKIYLDRFIGQQTLEFSDLLTQDQLAGSCVWRVCFFKSISPVVKQSSWYPKLSRKPQYVFAGLHSLKSLASKLVAVTLPFLSLHFAAPFSQSVHHRLAHSRGSFQTLCFCGCNPRPPQRSCEH